MSSQKRDLNILFMGTPYFAVPSLELMVKEGFNVSAVATVADKPAGRGYKLQESDVKKAAKKLGLPILQPVDLNDDSFLDELKSLGVNLIVIVAFRKLPSKIFEFPEFGTFNLHGSLLPDYRGAAPLNWAVMNGDKKTGVTTFFLEEKIDTGEIIAQSEIEVGENQTVGDVHDKLMHVGADLVLDTLKKIEEGQCQTIPQAELITDQHRKAPKIFKKDCEVNWGNSAVEVHNHIRGLSPYPAAYSTLCFPDGRKKKMKLFGSVVRDGKVDGKAGAIENDDKHIFVFCGKGQIALNEVQMEGKQKTKTEDFLRGNKLDDCYFE